MRQIFNSLFPLIHYLLILYGAHFLYYKIDIIAFWPEYTKMVLIL